VATSSCKEAIVFFMSKSCCWRGITEEDEGTGACCREEIVPEAGEKVPAVEDVVKWGRCWDCPLEE
jgi:hypothetical protein